MPILLSSLFIIQLISLYFVSRKTIRYMFLLLHRIIPSKSIINVCIAIIFFPGTVLHELSHFLMAILLFLKVREIHILPEWNNEYLKLGRVLYEKKDIVRSIIVGIAPIFVGLLFLWWMSIVEVLRIEHIFLRIAVLYLIFAISSTMFSSKQDLVDVVYALPIILIMGVLFYFFPIDLSFINKQQIVIEATQKFLYDVNIYLGISITIHAVLWLILAILLHLFKTKI